MTDGLLGRRSILLVIFSLRTVTTSLLRRSSRRFDLECGQQMMKVTLP